jgi:pilus assembly protein Flp/PilA
MNSGKAILGQLVQEESGQDLIEYALLAALISLCCVGILSTVGKSLNTVFTKINSNL